MNYFSSFFTVSMEWAYLIGLLGIWGGGENLANEHHKMCNFYIQMSLNTALVRVTAYFLYLKWDEKKWCLIYSIPDRTIHISNVIECKKIDSIIQLNSRNSVFWINIPFNNWVSQKSLRLSVLLFVQLDSKSTKVAFLSRLSFAQLFLLRVLCYGQTDKQTHRNPQLYK